MTDFATLYWENESLVILDQRRLPSEEVYLPLKNLAAACEAIRTLAVRGAPAIGVAAAYSAVLGANALLDDPAIFHQSFQAVCAQLAATRPTAVNLVWALKRLSHVLSQVPHPASVPELKKILLQEAHAICAEDKICCQKIGAHGSIYFDDGDGVLTHCNAGALATAGMGTALAPIYVAAQTGKKIKVFADETRPLLQGARLTTWELKRRSIDVTLITDSMAASLMYQGFIQKVIVGADRIAANGDVANKIGTYGVAVLARHHGIPFYVAAPLSTIDPQAPNGSAIVIEERHSDEVTSFAGFPIAPEGVKVKNPAFDVTPAELVTAIITDAGVLKPPYLPAIKKLFQ